MPRIVEFLDNGLFVIFLSVSPKTRAYWTWITGFMTFASTEFKIFLNCAFGRSVLMLNLP